MNEIKIEDELEIFLVTYNRKNYLKKTLESLFSCDSPIKECDFTILDNKSDDGTQDLLEEYARTYPNIKYIHHKHNIGGNANIARCYELAEKPYFWILCDDDAYDWSSWNEVASYIADNADAIVVSNYVNPQDSIAQLLCQLSFVPGAIYRNTNITDTVMQNMEFQISTLFPHLALACELINQNKKIAYIKGNAIVSRLSHPENESYTRGVDGNKHPIMANMTWTTGMMQSLQLLADSNMRKEVVKTLTMDNGEKILMPSGFLYWNQKIGHRSYYNYSVYKSLLPKSLHFVFGCATCVETFSFYFLIFRQALKKTLLGKQLLQIKRLVYPGKQ